jgi:hypothetical protein
MLLLLITTLSHNSLGRPQADDDVKIITNPSPGQEYVVIHKEKTVIPLKQSKQLDADAHKGEYTSVWFEVLGVLQQIVCFTSTSGNNSQKYINLYWVSAVLECGSVSLGEWCRTFRDNVVITFPRNFGHESPNDGRRIPEE